MSHSMSYWFGGWVTAPRHDPYRKTLGDGAANRLRAVLTSSLSPSLPPCGCSVTAEKLQSFELSCFDRSRGGVCTCSRFRVGAECVKWREGKLRCGANLRCRRNRPSVIEFFPSSGQLSFYIPSWQLYFPSTAPLQAPPAPSALKAAIASGVKGARETISKLC